MKSAEKHFVVIGGGISGITTALLLSRHGLRVTIAEKKRRLGSTLRGFSRQGIHFDTGFHYAGGLSPHGPLTRYFHLLRLEHLPLKDYNSDCFDRVRFLSSGTEIRLPVGREALEDALCSAFPADAAFIRRYLVSLQESFSSSVFLNFSEYARTLIKRKEHALPLASVLAQGTRNIKLRSVLALHSLLYGVSPAEAPFSLHARVDGSYLEGVKTVAGGGRAIIAALEKRLDKAGVETVCGAAVEKLRCSPPRGVTGVLLEDERLLPADGVVFTAHPALLPSLFPEGSVKPAYSRRLAALEDTVSAYTLFCKLPSPPAEIRGSNLFLCPTDDIQKGFLPDAKIEEGPFYVCASQADGEGAAGESALIAFAPADPLSWTDWKNTKTGKRPAGYGRQKTETLGRFRQAVTSCWPDNARAEVLAGGTPLTLRDFLEAPGCGLYGTKHSVHQYNPLPVTRIPNLWLAGQSVVAPGILGAVISGVLACGCILGMEIVRGEVARCM
ncbi:MAG: NAD(P)/FAD-dependent oxidoreductase [Desulfovibrio sp.]|jgi:all-trans-retinol 13,14-reductase|nr:NAD(P)/FAD-dependent oxidoreductase [Desulfovibrio sp.]